MKKQITNRQLIHWSTKQGMGGNLFAEACKDIRGLAIVSAIIEAEERLQKEGDKLRKILQKEFGERVEGERLSEYFDYLDKQIEIDLPEVEISTEKMDQIDPTPETVKALNLIRKPSKSK